jgi:hypothetical protein
VKATEQSTNKILKGMLVMKNIMLVACVAILGILLVGAGQVESIEDDIDLI